MVSFVLLLVSAVLVQCQQKQVGEQKRNEREVFFFSFSFFFLFFFFLFSFFFFLLFAGQYVRAAQVTNIGGASVAAAYYEVSGGRLLFTTSLPNSIPSVIPTLASNASLVGEYLSLAIVSGNPAISFFRLLDSALCYTRASNTAGTSWPTPATPV